MFKWKKMTKDFEGFRERPYRDTLGIPTVGYGFNISAGGVPEEVASGSRSMSREEADAIFEPKYLEAEGRARSFAGPVYDRLPEEKKAILNDMAYNLGDRLFKFENMQAAIHEQRFGDVPKEMKDSKWYKQVGRRSKALISLWNDGTTDLPQAPAEAPKLSRFGAAFKAAKEQGLQQFMFDGKPIAVR